MKGRKKGGKRKIVERVGGHGAELVQEQRQQEKRNRNKERIETGDENIELGQKARGTC